MNMKFVRTFAMLALTMVIGLSVTGGTIAWFTDNVSSSANVIQAGNLDVDVTYDGTNSIQSVSTLFNDVKLWEPGAVAWENLTVVNKGDLALKYEMAMNTSAFNSVDGNDLTGALKVGIVPGGITVPTTNTDSAAAREAVLAEVGSWSTFSGFNAAGNLSPNGSTEGVSSKTYGVVVYWQPTAEDNKWNVNNGKTTSDGKPLFIDLGVKLIATQKDAELDSFGPDYDAGASLSTVKSAAELKYAITAANDGDIIVLGSDITDADGIVIDGKNITIDLNGKTFTTSEGASTNNRNFKITGNSKVTIKNGTLIAAGDQTSGAYGTIRTEGAAQVTLDNVKLYSYRGRGLNVKALSGTKVIINNSEIYSQYGGGVEAAGGEIVLNNVKIDQKGVDSANAWCSVAIGVNGGGKITVNSGSYSAAPIATDSNAAQGAWVAYVMSSGGTLDINGGTFNGTVAETTTAANACGVICADTKAVVNINGGTFNSNGAILDMRNNTGEYPNPVANLNGGTFSANPTVSGLYSSNLIQVASGYVVKDNGNGTWTVSYDGSLVSSAAELTTALSAGKNIMLASDISYDKGIIIPEGLSFDGNGKTITYTGTDYNFQLVKLNTDAKLENVNLKNYKVRTEDTTSGTVTMKNVKISMDNDQTGLDISRGSGTAKLTNVTCKGIKDAAHLDPNTQVQVDYTPYGDVLLGTKWGLEATDCDFGSLHGWNTTNGSNVHLNNTKYTVFRMHYWSNRTLYIDGVQTAWSDSDAIPVAHDVGGCWSVQSAFK